MTATENGSACGGTVVDAKSAGKQGRAPSPPKRVETEPGYPLIGSVIDVLRDGPGFLSGVARRHPGEIVGVRLGPVRIYLVSHPDHVQHVLVDHARDFVKGDMWRAVRALMGNGLVLSEGDFWLRQRRMMQPIFNASHLASLTDLMTDVIDRQIVRWEKNPTLDMAEEMMTFTQPVLLETLFGTSIDPREADRLRDQIMIAVREMNLRIFLYFLPERFPLPGDRAFRDAVATIDEALLRMVGARRASGQKRNDLLSLLMHARDEGAQQGMDDRQLRDELVTLFVGGNETTARTMTWLWYALDQHPEVDRKLRAEVAEVLGDRRPAYADLARLVYTKQVIQETMRLYPPAWMWPRFAVKDVVVDGYPIPARSTLLLCPLATHRDPAFWPDPERFVPERFAPANAAERPRCAYYPFSTGPRQCIGNAFAMLEAQLLTVRIVQRYRPRLVPGQRVVLSSATTLKPRDGMKMTLEPAPSS
jgi:cytochrome P450